MNKELASYIKKYFGHLMTDDERLALNHHIYTYKTSNNPRMRKKMIEKGWISEKEEVLELLENGYEVFELTMAKRIMAESPEKVFINNCPKCLKLARTPYARQCRNCGHTWHNIVVAKFRLEKSFELTNRPYFFMLGQIEKGKVKIGQYIDLTFLGLSQRANIEVIEFALIKEAGQAIENVVLGISELTKEERKYIVSKGNFGIPIDILKATAP